MMPKGDFDIRGFGGDGPTRSSSREPDEIEIEITPAMVRVGMSALIAAEDEGEYLDKTSALVFTAMLAVCDHPKFRVSVGDSARYATE